MPSIRGKILNSICPYFFFFYPARPDSWEHSIPKPHCDVPQWVQRSTCTKIVGKKRIFDLSALLFSVFFQQTSGILLKLGWNFGIIGLEVCRSDSVKCIWEIPNKEDNLSWEENPYNFRGTMPPGVL